MASHSGLKYILETKKGYVRKDGGFTFKKEEALLIDFWQFGFGPSALEVYKRLGFNNEDVLDSGVSFKTIIPSYEGRDYIGVSYYMLMGFDYNMAVEKAREDCYKYNLMDDNNCLRYEEMLKANVLSYYQSRKNVDKVLDTSEGKILLYKVGDKEEVLGGILEEYYSEKGSIYRYSLPLKNPHVERYFNITEDKVKEYNHFQQDGLVDYFIKRFNEEKFNWGLNYDTKILDIKIVDDRLEIVLDDWSNINGNKVARKLNEVIRDFYSKKEMHITRMFGSYVILERIDGELKAVEATPVPIKYCPLMVKLLREVGGSNSDEFIEAIRTENVDVQVKMMCELIDNVVIKGGYFDTNRPLNSCEANVLFGASETISSAFKSNMLDAAIIVSNNLGTIITTNDTNTQGAVKRMTGLFYTSPDKNIMEEAINSKIIPVFPYSAKIDQVEGVKEAIRRGYKRIAVTLAAYDNELWEEIAKLENNGIVIYKFGLCSTGISRKTAQMMLENADIVWSCASKYVKELIEPNAIAQVGIKIPVHIMTGKGWELVRNHLAFMVSQEIEDVTLLKGDEKPVFLNSEDGIKRLVKKDIKRCNDCPNPCI
ncbi:MAG TPA: hypothetical protein DCE23_08910 [Firmicutes bacterium]|nr:hypothetical protein [Bacillota bacterium]